jgi:hypothetical protein
MSIITQLRCEAYRRALDHAGYCNDSAVMALANDRDWLEEAADAGDVHSILKAAGITPTIDASNAYRLGLQAATENQRSGAE